MTILKYMCATLYTINWWVAKIFILSYQDDLPPSSNKDATLKVYFKYFHSSNVYSFLKLFLIFSSYSSVHLLPSSPCMQKSKAEIKMIDSFLLLVS
mmetsp:Transcript_20084/g.24748  ORF Transcript_20084/g.24748 Transcript_20084/m.24748 type:complete len:96 (+) Transcript_20084:634-921(+)